MTANGHSIDLEKVDFGNSIPVGAIRSLSTSFWCEIKDLPNKPWSIGTKATSSSEGRARQMNTLLPACRAVKRLLTESKQTGDPVKFHVGGGREARPGTIIAAGSIVSHFYSKSLCSAHTYSCGRPQMLSAYAEDIACGVYAAYAHFRLIPISTFRRNVPVPPACTSPKGRLRTSLASCDCANRNAELLGTYLSRRHPHGKVVWRVSPSQANPS